MHHVTQNYDTDCALAVAAMLADCGLSYARELLPVRGRGLRPEELQGLLTKLTGQSWLISRRGQGKPLVQYEGLPERGAVLLRKHGNKWGHWIAVADGRVHDPEKSRASPLAGYYRQHWVIVRILAPGD